MKEDVIGTLARSKQRNIKYGKMGKDNFPFTVQGGITVQGNYYTCDEKEKLTCKQKGQVCKKKSHNGKLYFWKSSKGN